jgi:hypothetical protein
MRTITRIALVSSLALAACSSSEPDVDSTGASLYQITGRCPASALTLYDQTNFSGDSICYGGTGLESLPPPWHGKVRSFRSGSYRVRFTTYLGSSELYCAGVSKAVASPIVQGAIAVKRLPDSSIDAGSCAF